MYCCTIVYCTAVYCTVIYCTAVDCTTVYCIAVYLNRHMPSGQSRVYRVTQLCTDGVHCRDSAGTGPVNLKVAPNGCCLGRSSWTNKYALLFPTPTIIRMWMCSFASRGRKYTDKANRLYLMKYRQVSEP